MIYSIGERESKRITSIRAICVILIIYLHQYVGDLVDAEFTISGAISGNTICNSIQYIISRIITFSAVPLFFLMSSVLLYAKEFTLRSNMKKKLKTLVLPYVIWISIYILLYFVGQSIPLTARFFGNEGRKISDMTFIDYVGAYTGIGGHGLFVNALWFMRDLIILNLLAPLIKKVIDGFPYLYLILILLLFNVGTIPEILVLNKLSIVFFSLGYYVVKYNLRMEEADKFSSTRIVLLYAILITVEYYFYQTNNGLRVAVHSFSVFTGIMLLIKMSGYIINSPEAKVPKVLSIIANYSFFVYSSHDFIQTVFKKLSVKIFVQSDLIQMIEFFLIPVLVCVSCVELAIFVKRILPKLYNIMTGSRSV